MLLFMFLYMYVHVACLCAGAANLPLSPNLKYTGRVIVRLTLHFNRMVFQSPSLCGGNLNFITPTHT